MGVRACLGVGWWWGCEVLLVRGGKLVQSAADAGAYQGKPMPRDAVGSVGRGSEVAMGEMRVGAEACRRGPAAGTMKRGV